MKKLLYHCCVSMVLAGCLLVGSVRAQENEGLVGYWKFDEGKGVIVKDYSGKNNHGLVKGGAEWVKTDRGYALRFDGESVYVDCGSSDSLNPKEAMTFEVWFNVDKDSTNIDICSRENIGPGWEPYRFVIGQNNTRGNLAFVPTNSKGERFLNFGTGKNSFTPGEWTHFAVSWDGQKGSMFVNGVRKSDFEFSDIRTSKGTTVIGRRGFPANFFKGLIREVRIYNRALGEKEIKKHYEELKR